MWLIKWVVAPVDRTPYRASGGRISLTGRLIAPTLLLTTTGRRTGAPRTTPVFYLTDGDRLVICNVNPGFERPNPWTVNVGANPLVLAQVGRRVGRYRARDASDDELTRFWPMFEAVWPPYSHFHEQGGRRSVFVLAPLADDGTLDARRRSARL